MFKKSLIAVASMTALAGSAMAADVNLYGLVDYGFQYEAVDQGSEQFEKHGFSMKSGMNSGSRFGLKAMAIRSVSCSKTASALTTVRSAMVAVSLVVKLSSI